MVLFQGKIFIILVDCFILEVIWWSYYKKCKKGKFQKSVFFIVDPNNSNSVQIVAV